MVFCRRPLSKTHIVVRRGCNFHVFLLKIISYFFTVRLPCTEDRSISAVLVMSAVPAVVHVQFRQFFIFNHVVASTGI